MDIGNLGYTSGLFEGMKDLANIQGQQARTQQTQLQNQMLVEEKKREDQERQLLSQAFKSQADDKRVADQNSANTALAQQYFNVGKRLMGIDPKKGMDFMKEGDRLQHQGVQEQLTTAKLQEVKEEHMREVASQVTDQQSLDEAIKEFSKNGAIIPQRFRQWNEQTKAWLYNKATLSKNVQEAQKVQQAGREADLKERQEARRKLSLLLRNEDNLRKEQLKRDNMATKAKIPWKEPTEFALGTEMSILKGTEEFHSLTEKGDKFQAARDVYYEAYQLMKNGKTDSQAEAMDQAKEVVLSRIKNGKYVKEEGTKGAKGNTNFQVPDNAPPEVQSKANDAEAALARGVPKAQVEEMWKRYLKSKGL